MIVDIKEHLIGLRRGYAEADTAWLTVNDRGCFGVHCGDKGVMAKAVPKGKDLNAACFTVCDKDFPERAKAKGGGVILGGLNYGQGSSREHAALVPLYLGIKAVVAKSFARIHVANLINFGIVPMTLKDAEDYEKFAQGDQIEIQGFADAVANVNEAILVNKTNGASAKLVLSLSERQRAILLAGGRLNYTKQEK